MIGETVRIGQRVADGQTHVGPGELTDDVAVGEDREAVRDARAMHEHVDALTGQRGDNPYCYYRATTLAKRGLRETIAKVAEAPPPVTQGLEEAWRDGSTRINPIMPPSSCSSRWQW